MILTGTSGTFVCLQPSEAHCWLHRCTRSWHDALSQPAVLVKLTSALSPYLRTFFGPRHFTCQVVVDSDQTAKALLERGQLTKRVTIIPLNQVRCLFNTPTIRVYCLHTTQAACLTRPLQPRQLLVLPMLLALLYICLWLRHGCRLRCCCISRHHHVHHVDCSNALHTSQLWRHHPVAGALL